MAYRKITLHPDLESWERQPGEQPRQYALFLQFRDLKPSERSYPRVAEISGKTARTIAQLGGANRWWDRAAAWDADQDRQRRHRLAEQDEEMGRAVMAAARAATATVLSSIRTIKDSGEPLDPKDIPRWAEAVERLRRIALDRPDQIIQVADRTAEGTYDFSSLDQLTPEERRARIREMSDNLVRAINGRGA